MFVVVFFAIVIFSVVSFASRPEMLEKAKRSDKAITRREFLRLPR